MFMVPPGQQQWPRGLENELHFAAADGSTKRTIAALSKGKIDIDQGDPMGWTPLMFAAQEGHSLVVRILLGRRANVSIADYGGVTALHLSAQHGHLAVTVDLAKAGAVLDAKDSKGGTPLHMAAQCGHSGVIAALIEAGAGVNCRAKNGSTPLYLAAMNGRLGAVKELLRVKADPLLTTMSADSRGGVSFVPLDIAARDGHSEVVQELIQQVGTQGCGGESGGVDALAAATANAHVGVMEVLMDAGVVDTGKALAIAAGSAREVSVKLLLQQRQRQGGIVDYVNSRKVGGRVPLFSGIDVYPDKQGVPRLISPKVVRLLIDAGADTSSVVRFTNPVTEVTFKGTALAFTNDCLRNKRVGFGKATAEQMHRLEGVRRLLMRANAVHAVSWLWVREPLLVGSDTAAGGSRQVVGEKTAAAASGTRLASMLPVLRRRRRGVLLAPLFRWGETCSDVFWGVVHLFLVLFPMLHLGTHNSRVWCDAFFSHKEPPSCIAADAAVSLTSLVARL